MSDSFDPYYKWLGIPPAEQPPHYYRLLGISLFEEDRDVIQTAVDRQMLLLKSVRIGKNARVAERILNEVATAKRCLLDKKKKASYDAELQTHAQLDQPLADDAGTDGPAEVATKGPVSAGASAGDVGKLPKARSVSPPRPGQAVETEEPSQPDSHVPKPEVLAPAVSVGAKSASSVAMKYKRRRRKAPRVWQHAAAIGIVAVGLIAALLIYAATRPESKSPALVTGGKAVEDDSYDSIPDVTSRRHQQDVTNRQQDPSRTQPRTATRPDEDDGGLPAAGEFLGKNRSTPSDSHFQQQSAQAERKARRKAFIEIMDRDHDAILRLTEYSEGVKQRFNELDKNGDSVLDKKEWPHDSADPNQDGKVDTAEYVALHKRIFTNLDQNKDECLTLDERKSDAPATPDTTTPAVEPPPQVADRLPVPDDGAQKRARSQIMRFYKDPISQAQTPEQKLELANNILAQLDQTSDIAERFMLYKLAGSLAAKAGDVQTAMDTVAKMSEVFEVDDLDEQVSLLTAALPNVRQRDNLAHLAQRSAMLTDEAVRRDKYDDAGRLISIAQKAARSSREIELLRQLISRGKDIKTIRGAFNRAERALAALEEDPQDADANQVVGEFLCVLKEDWQRGLPLLAQGKDPTLRDLAAREIAASAGEADALPLGDGWWEVAQKERGPGRKGLELRAAYWYRQALPGLSDAAKEQVAARLQKIEVKFPALITPTAPITPTYVEDTSVVIDPNGPWNQTMGDKVIVKTQISLNAGDVDKTFYEGDILQTHGVGGPGYSLIRLEDPDNPRSDLTANSGTWGWVNVSARGTSWEFAILNTRSSGGSGR